jgi:hypothetical protein
MPDFYVGYLPVPPGLKRFCRRLIGGLALVAAGAAAVLVLKQSAFPATIFEYQEYRDFQGILISDPYPALVAADGPAWLLVAPGKHGFRPPVGLNGSLVRVRGERILRGRDRAIEVQSFTAAGPVEPPADVDLGPTELTGEIVDAKCYFGVMNPGSGKVHRDCAARCLSGGLPPALVARDASGETRTVLIANWRRELLAHVGEPVTLRGRLASSAGRLILYAE